MRPMGTNKFLGVRVARGTNAVGLFVSGSSLEDGPANLGLPRGAVVGVSWTYVVDLSDRPIYLKGLVACVAAKGGVGDVDVVVGADVDGGDKIDGREHERFHCS